MTRSGALIRSDFVDQLTDAGRAAMVAYGVTTVIDLRTEGELAGRSDPRFPRPKANGSAAAGVRYLHLPLVADVGRRISDTTTAVGRYIEIVDERQAAFGTVFNAIAAADGGVVFHCFAGKDRTGLVAALLLELASVPREQIAADYGETDRQLARQYEIWIEQAPAELKDEIRGDLCCPAERIIGVLEHIDRKWGGVGAYLEAAGVSCPKLDVLSARLCS